MTGLTRRTFQRAVAGLVAVGGPAASLTGCDLGIGGGAAPKAKGPTKVTFWAYGGGGP